MVPPGDAHRMTPKHPIPADALDKHIGILGKTGSGKSNLAKTVAEHLLGRGSRVCVLDPTGTWWGLRLAANGKKASGHNVAIFGGEHGDLPIRAEHGQAIARAVGTTATSAIIDLRKIGVAGRTRFFTDFAETLIAENRGELHLIVDEAHTFMPQSGARGGGGRPAMLHAGNDLVSLGRGIGLRIVLITQRPAKLHKDALTQVETLVAMRLIAPQDRNAIDDWVGEAAGGDASELKASLATLKTGESWVWSPEIGHLARAFCPLAATFDSGVVQSQDKVELPSIDIEEVAAKLESARDEMEADDPVRLRRRIAELERELEARPDDRSAEVDELRRELNAARDGHERNRQYLHERVKGVAADLASLERDLATGIDWLPGGLESRKVEARHTTTPAPKRAPKHASPETPPESALPDGVEVTAPQRRILDALAWFKGLVGYHRVSRLQVAFMAGYKPGGGAFNNNLGALRSAGLVDYPNSGEVQLTDLGTAIARQPDVPVTTRQLQQAVMERLSGPQRRILQPLIDAYPDSLTVDELARTRPGMRAAAARSTTRAVRCVRSA